MITACVKFDSLLFFRLNTMYSCNTMGCSFRIRDRKIMEKHTVREHGVNRLRFYKKEDSVCNIEKGQIKSKKRGQSKCSRCGASYNNRVKPLNCICGNSMKTPEKNYELDALKLTGDYFSVRSHARGICKRVIVYRSENICYATECMDARAHFNNKDNFQCDHLKACSKARKINSANLVKISVEKIVEYIKCDKILNELNKISDEHKNITVYQIQESMLVLPVLADFSHECPSGLIHLDLKRLKCPIKKCSSKPRYHYLVKTELMCIHVFLCMMVKNEGLTNCTPETKSASSTKHQFSKAKTVSTIVKNVVQNVPSVLHREKEERFLQQSFAIQQELLLSADISKFESKKCSECNTPNVLRKKKYPRSFLVTPGYLIEVEMNIYRCKKCSQLQYPNMYKEGFVPVSENLIVSWSYMVEARNQIKNGSKLYSFFLRSLKRLYLENKKLAPRFMKVDFHNMAVGLAKVTVAYNSVTLLQPVNGLDSLSSVLCLHCGAVPVTLMSDGNAKNSILLRDGSDNLVFNPDDNSNVYDLESFIMKCSQNVIGSALFQHYPKDTINIYKIPLIIGKSILGEMRNREHMKKSVFHEDIDLSLVDFSKLEYMIRSGEFNLLKSRSLPLKKLRNLAKELNIPKSSKQSKIMLENIMLELSNWLIGGNSSCHNYMHAVGESGGWTDQWCVHNIKYASKMMVLQESVVDPADIYISLMYPPVLLICDDPCTLVSHMFCSESEFANLMFGSNKGCFEPPHKVNLPRTNIDCPEILPLSIYPRKPCPIALSDPTSKVHPISKNVLRKVLGTRLSESHKSRNQCLYHNIGNCKQAAQVKVIQLTSNIFELIFCRLCPKKVFKREESVSALLLESASLLRAITCSTTCSIF